MIQRLLLTSQNQSQFVLPQSNAPTSQQVVSSLLAETLKPITTPLQISCNTAEPEDFA